MSNFNFNKTILGGRLTATPELKTTTSGIPVCSFTIAINRKGAKEQTTDFIRCNAWRNSAEFISKFFKKGSSICVIGSIQTNGYTDKDGNKRTSTEVNVDEALFVDGKNDNASGQTETQAPAEAPTTGNFIPIGADDDIPF